MGGETHFLYSIRELAWKYGYITSYIVLRQEETPFHRLDLVYKSVVENLVYSQPAEKLLSSDYDKGIEAVIKKWYTEKYNEISKKVGKINLDEELRAYVNSLKPYDCISFRNAVKEAFLALLDKHDEDFYLILQWLKGENPPKNKLKKFNIFEKIDKSTAFRMLRSLVQWLSDIGYSGLIVLMDEAEPTSSMSSRQRSTLVNNLRELIDECGQASFGRTMWFYAAPDENFLEGRASIYEALRQRVSTVFDAKLNPTGVKIYLEKIPMEPIAHLKEIGEKLAKIYEIAYGEFKDKKSLDETIENIAKAAYGEKAGNLDIKGLSSKIS
jgi:succinate dehydrogenase flavin-adding protein (antitoxin of CptAB toxin-antitoxin module)